MNRNPAAVARAARHAGPLHLQLACHGHWRVRQPLHSTECFLFKSIRHTYRRPFDVFLWCAAASARYVRPCRARHAPVYPCIHPGGAPQGLQEFLQ
jgi:hypothetical protein